MRTVARFCFSVSFVGFCIVTISTRTANGTYGIAVGDNGAIRQTPDGGNWFPRSSGTTQSLKSVSCDGKFCWVVGDGGTILHSDDAGITWNGQISGTSQTLRGVDFVTRNQGWAVGDGGTILTTTNGGVTWTAQDSISITNFFDVDFVNASIGWIGGESGTIRHTIDGGTNWSFQTSGSTSAIEGIDFTSETDGWYASRSHYAGKTTNGGSDWTVYPTSLDFRDVSFVTANKGVLVGKNSNETGYTLFTDNGVMNGNWTIGVVIQTGTLNSVSINRDDIGWSVGVAGAIWKTLNGGRTWSVQSSGTSQELWGVAAFDVFADGDYNQDRMVDGADYQIWRSVFGSTSDFNSDGNGNGRVDAADYVVWRSQLPARSALTDASMPETVPEATSFSLFALAIMLVSLRRNRPDEILHRHRALIIAVLLERRRKVILSVPAPNCFH